MNAPTALATRSSSRVPPVPADEGLGLAALLELLGPEEPAAAVAPTRSSFRADGTRLRAWVQAWVHRAAEWGAGPGGAWRAW